MIIYIMLDIYDILEPYYLKMKLIYGIDDKQLDDIFIPIIIYYYLISNNDKK